MGGRTYESSGRIAIWLLRSHTKCKHGRDIEPYRHFPDGAEGECGEGGVLTARHSAVKIQFQPGVIALLFYIRASGQRSRKPTPVQNRPAQTRTAKHGEFPKRRRFFERSVKALIQLRRQLRGYPGIDCSGGRVTYDLTPKWYTRRYNRRRATQYGVAMRDWATCQSFRETVAE